MKSLLGLIFVLLIFVTVVGGGALLWYLSKNTEFSRKDAPPAATEAPAR